MCSLLLFVSQQQHYSGIHELVRPVSKAVLRAVLLARPQLDAARHQHDLFLACENIRFPSLFAAGDVTRETSPAGEERGETDVFAGYLVSAVEFNSVLQNCCCRKQNKKIKKQLSELLMYSNVFLIHEMSTACRATRRQQHDSLAFKRRATAVLKSNLNRSIQFGKAVARRLKRA